VIGGTLDAKRVSLIEYEEKRGVWAWGAWRAYLKLALTDVVDGGGEGSNAIEVTEGLSDC